jgi:hypothetical protein
MAKDKIASLGSRGKKILHYPMSKQHKLKLEYIRNAITHQQMSRQRDQRIWIERSEISAYRYSQLIFDKRANAKS